MRLAHLVSDVHLEDGREDLTAIFLRFLAGRARELPELYLLGDLFEVWVGDDDDAPLPARVAEGLLELGKAGVRVWWMHGNRDFLVGADFAARSGVTLIEDPTVVELGGVRTLLTHGDRYCTSDERYVAFRAESRSSSWQTRLLAQPLAARRALALQYRQQSMTSQQARIEAGMGLTDVTSEAVEDEFIGSGVPRIIHGHTHQPALHVHLLPGGGNGERFVLSDWRDVGEAVEVCSDGSLVRHILT